MIAHPFSSPHHTTLPPTLSLIQSLTAAPNDDDASFYLTQDDCCRASINRLTLLATSRQIDRPAPASRLLPLRFTSIPQADRRHELPQADRYDHDTPRLAPSIPQANPTTRSPASRPPLRHLRGRPTSTFCSGDTLLPQDDRLSTQQIKRRHDLPQADRSRPRLQFHKPTRRHALRQADRLYATLSIRGRLSVPQADRRKLKRYSRKTTDSQNSKSTDDTTSCKPTAHDHNTPRLAPSIPQANCL
ncbi:hypothetical protein CPB85DRAFT_1430785 [Mucidula mucida]|nr:hypothetical protein CPB85DRAFT_1430785 [Mucidula mucida]